MSDQNNDILLFDIYSCKVVKRDEKYFVKYDSGGIASGFVENEITAAESERIKLSEKDAYNVIVATQQRELPKKCDTQ